MDRTASKTTRQPIGAAEAAADSALAIKPGIRNLPKYTYIHRTAALPIGNVELTTGGPHDQPYIDHLQQHFRRQVGYVPRTGMFENLARLAYWVCRLNGEPAGYLLLTGGFRVPLRIAQIAIDEQLWRSGLGLLATLEVLKLARAMGWEQVKACTLHDLPANELWGKLGGDVSHIEHKSARHDRWCNHWIIPADEINLASFDDGHNTRNTSGH